MLSLWLTWFILQLKALLATFQYIPWSYGTAPVKKWMPTKNKKDWKMGDSSKSGSEHRTRWNITISCRAFWSYSALQWEKPAFCIIAKVPFSFISVPCGAYGCRSLPQPRWNQRKIKHLVCLDSRYSILRPSPLNKNPLAPDIKLCPTLKCLTITYTTADKFPVLWYPLHKYGTWHKTFFLSFYFEVQLGV